MEKIIYSIDDLKQFTNQLYKDWYKKFLLKWDLWAWKTEFVKQFANILWIKNITSPTYTYINNYENKLLHWDFYRIKNEIELLNLWIIEEMEEFEYICIEWPKFSHLYANSNWLEIEIKKTNLQERIIKYNPRESKK